MHTDVKKRGVFRSKTEGGWEKRLAKLWRGKNITKKARSGRGQSIKWEIPIYSFTMGNQDDTTTRSLLRRVKSISLSLILMAAVSAAHADEARGTLDNGAVAWRWRTLDGVLQPIQIEDKQTGATLPLIGECFELTLDDSTLVRASDFKMDAGPEEEALKSEPDSPRLASRVPGRQLVARFSDLRHHLTAEWRVILRDGSRYVRQELVLRAVDHDVFVKEIILLEEKIPGAETVGVVDGSPVVAGNFFFGYEHPMARNVVDDNSVVRCEFPRNATLQAGETLTQSCVVGIASPGQLRRSFLAYLERERAHPYRPFLHYNSWYDIAWDNRKYNERESVEAINEIGHELAQNRAVKIDSFLFDDGWDDNRTLWKFHAGFPDGFTPLKEAAAKYGAGIGVWLSPFGGYSQAREQRIECGYKQGFETNANGFSLGGPRYYRRFHDICMEMIGQYGVNQFKFDGLAAGATATGSGLMRDGDAMMRLIADLRVADPGIYINQTTGTWPSPFWLAYVDSTWRGGGDHDFQGKGSWCQQWMTYRDAETYKNVVTRGPLYPLNSLMLHGIIYATNAEHLQSMSDEDFADQAREFFGTGTQLQEMYITAKLLNRQNWDDLAEAANWSRSNADVLGDIHWAGGDPGRGEVYGYAAWSPRKAILVLRNPDGKPAGFSGDPSRMFELPAGVPGRFSMRSPWKRDGSQPATVLEGGRPFTFNLRPLQLLVLEEEHDK
jgi:hypothetical protein